MSILSTSSAQCRDCYKCLRSCPVKAIRVIDNHAQIWEEACILDGACVNVCPQKAKRVSSELGKVKAMVAQGPAVVASVAPSFWAAYGVERGLRLGSVLKKLGFAAARSTAETAREIAKEHYRYLGKVDHPVISSCCPAVVALVEKHFPALSSWLAPVVSPMIAHGAAIRATYGADTRVVFIGPCMAKKEEAMMGWEQFDSDVDGVLSFVELEEWVRERGCDWPKLPVAGVSEAPALARSFPMEGGLAEAVAGTEGIDDFPVISISGTENCRDTLEGFLQKKAGPGPMLLEMFACEGGCINGPLMPSNTTTVSRRLAMIRGLKVSQRDEESRLKDAALDLSRSFSPRPFPWKIPSEEEVASILAELGKHTLADELDCGACGYDSCRDKAVAVYNGAAEAQMCIPYMRARAESLANIILEATPNGVIAVDGNLRILFLNPAAERMFQADSQALEGERIHRLFPPDHYEAAMSSDSLLVVDQIYQQYDLFTRQYLLHVPEENLVMGIFIDVTADVKQRQELHQLRRTTLTQAQQVIDKQMRVAQEIAGLLGETTAETKVALTKLIKLMQQEDVSVDNGGI